MTDPKIDLQNNIQFDIDNEIKHMMFYLYASNLAEGMHREELKKFFLKEAHEEMDHIHEFSEILIQCYGCPSFRQEKYNFPETKNPYELLGVAIKLETEVVQNYVKRINEMGNSNDPEIIAIRLFYEKQLCDSQQTIWTIRRMVKKFAVKVEF